MMGNFYGGMMAGTGLGPLLGLITWIALISFFILGSVYFWKMINKK